METDSPKYILYEFTSVFLIQKPRLNLKKDSSIPFELPENVEEEGIITEIIAYKYSNLKLITYFFGCIITLGFLHLLCHWSLKCNIYFKLKKTFMSEAETLLILCKG